MITVNNRLDLVQALRRKENPIIIVGSLADEIRDLAAKSVGCTANCVADLAISAAKLALLIGGVIALYGLYKGYDVEFKPDGTVRLTKRR